MQQRRLVYEPARSDGVAAWSRGVDQHWREALHPAEQGDVIDVDPALREEFFEVAVRQREAEVPANRQHDHFWREPEPRER